MKTVLHLHTHDSEESVFYHLIDETLQVKEGDIIDYGKRYYYMLGNKAKEEFEKHRLSMGEYKVVSTYLESNEVYVFLRPI